MLLEVAARAPHGCSEIIENYDIHTFCLQRSYLAEMFDNVFGIRDISVLRNMSQWRFTFHKVGSAKHHSVALSASFVKERQPTEGDAS
jgi:hypothetical protein